MSGNAAPGRPVASRPQRLHEIVGALHPWLRSRICSITVRPVKGGWDAILTYVAKTLPPPPDLHLSPRAASDPMDTHHPLDLPALGVETVLCDQIRELAAIRDLGTVQVEKVIAPAESPAGEPPVDPHLSQPVWRLRTHAGLVHERRTWLSRIGRRDFDK